MEYRVGGFAKPRGKTKAYRKLPINAGDFNPVNLITVDSTNLLFLTDFIIRTKPSDEDPSTRVEYVMWKVMLGDRVLWINEEVLRLPRKDEVPQEAWAACGL